MELFSENKHLLSLASSAAVVQAQIYRLMFHTIRPVDGAVENMGFLMVFHATVHVLRMCLAFYGTQIAFL